MLPEQHVCPELPQKFTVVVTGPLLLQSLAVMHPRVGGVPVEGIVQENNAVPPEEPVYAALLQFVGNTQLSGTEFILVLHESVTVEL